MNAGEKHAEAASKCALGAAKLKREAVSTAKIGNGAIASEKLADSSVSGPKLAEGSVTSSKIANGAVTGNKVDTGSLGTAPTAVEAVRASRATEASHAAKASVAGLAEEAEYLDGLPADQLGAPPFLTASTKLPATSVDADWWVPASGLGQVSSQEEATMFIGYRRFSVDARGPGAARLKRLLEAHEPNLARLMEVDPPEDEG